MSDLLKAPVDVKTRILPTKIWDDKASISKFRQESASKDVFVKDGKRRVPREGMVQQGKSLDGDYASSAEKKSVEDAGRTLGGIFCRDSDINLEDSSLFEEDLAYEEPKKEFPGPYDPERVRQLYLTACKQLDVLPTSRFMRGLDTGRVNAGHQGLGPLGARAVAISLVTNLTVTELHIPGNKLGPLGMQCMAGLIHGNEVIKVLNISDNDLGREGAKVLAAAIKENDSIQQINAAENKFDDPTGAYFEEALRVNSQIRQLDLSRNQLSIAAGIAIARGMEDNDTVTHLDLSYNHLRRQGIKGIAKMLTKNLSLMNLDLSWNGVGTDGATQLGEGLKENDTLTVLGLNGCRLNAEALMIMLGKMKTNKMLKALQISNNPLTSADLCLFLKAIDSLPEIAINYIDAGSVTISTAFLDLVKHIQASKPGFWVDFRGVLAIKDQSKNMLQNLDLNSGDPLEALIKYSRTKNLRLVDLFSRFDLDKSGTMTRQELIRGVASAGIPLSIKQMDRLVAKLDRDGDGEIDFAELLDGYKKYMRNLHKQGKVARNFLKMTDNDLYLGFGESRPSTPRTPGSRKSSTRLSGRVSVTGASMSQKRKLSSPTADVESAFSSDSEGDLRRRLSPRKEPETPLTEQSSTQLIEAAISRLDVLVTADDIAEEPDTPFDQHTEDAFPNNSDMS